MKLIRVSLETLLLFMQQQVTGNNAFGLLEGWSSLLRESRTKQIVPHFRLIKKLLKQDRPLGHAVATLLCGWLCDLRLYPLFISSGILRGIWTRDEKSPL